MKIGIIGGNGTAATNKLLTLIEEEMTKKGAFRDCHHPELIVWYATKAPSRSLYLEGRGESFVDDYVFVAKKLKECGADKICMCCNTAHYAIDEISKKADIPFINLVEEIAKRAKGYEKVGLMASDGAIAGEVFKKAFDKICPEVEIIYPDEEFQKMLTKGICNVKDYHRFEPQNSKDRPFNLFKKVQEHLKSKGAKIVIAGCTDIRVDYFERENIDSVEVLKDLIIKESFSK